MLNEFINDIVRVKRGDLLDFPENEDVFNTYITQRVISMFSPKLCHIVNETTNKRMKQLSKREAYHLLITVIPKQGKSFTKFFKKDKVEFSLTDKQKNHIEFLMQKHEVSRREVYSYIKEFDLDVNGF